MGGIFQTNLISNPTQDGIFPLRNYYKIFMRFMQILKRILNLITEGLPWAAQMLQYRESFKRHLGLGKPYLLLEPWSRILIVSISEADERGLLVDR